MGLGASKPVFSPEELDVYEACTCLNASEILALYDKYTKLGGVRPTSFSHESHYRRSGNNEAPTQTGGSGDVEAGNGSTTTKVKMAKVVAQEEFCFNPFAERLCKIFSSEEKESAETYGDLDFDEYVDLYNVLSPKAKKETKIQTAFRLYDADDDGYLTPDDLTTLLKTVAMTQPAAKGSSAEAKGAGGEPEGLLEEDEVKQIVERVMRECDIDGNGRLSYAEFAKVLGRIPEFPAKFAVFIA